jgi:Ca-activated chloride channel family protein
VKTAKAAADAGVRIFTVGVGTAQGSLIPITGQEGGTAFVKDSKGQVVKSKLDEKRLREVAQATGGFYLHLENGSRTMQQLFTEGLTKMQAAEIDVRLSRRPIERYDWPLAAAIVALATSMLIGDRKRVHQASHRSAPAPVPAAAALALLLLSLQPVVAAAPGLEAYRDGKFNDAYQEFQQTLKTHPQTNAADKLQFDSGAAAYKMKDYGKALESFSQALLSSNTGLQSKSHYNLGNTLYGRGEAQQSDEKKLIDWTNALAHYEQTLKLDPQNKEAKDNYEYVKRKIEELRKKQQQQPSPSPSPSPNKQQKDNKQDKEQQKKQQEQDQQQSSQQDRQQQQDQQQQQQEQQQQSQSQNQPGTGQNQKPESSQDQSQAKNEPQKKQESKPGESPSPSPGAEQQQATPSPSPGEGKNEQDQQSSPGEKQADRSPTPGEGQDETPSPSPGEGEGSGEDASPSPTPAESPQKKFAGEIKGASGDKAEKPSDQSAQMAEAEPEKEGQMSERQAEALLQSMKDEEARVQLDERKVARHVYNDW